MANPPVSPLSSSTTAAAPSPADRGSQGYQGSLDISGLNGNFNQLAFLAKQILNKAATTSLVLVKAVTNSGGVSAVGFVDVQPLVHQIDGAGNATPHGTIHHLPYLRLQGGANAIILDPVVGDIGMACFCSHDISSVKRTKKAGVPGSRRRFDWADGLYIGGMLNGVPTQFIRFSSAGIDIQAPNGKLTFTAQNAALDATGNLACMGDIVAFAGSGATQITMGHHLHGTGTAAAGTSVPTPGH